MIVLHELLVEPGFREQLLVISRGKESAFIAEFFRRDQQRAFNIEFFNHKLLVSSKHIGKGELYPAVIQVDGADNAVWQYVLPTEGSEVKVGARVVSALLPQEDRTGEVNDFIFKLL